jgi:hypothetical protein
MTRSGSLLQALAAAGITSCNLSGKSVSFLKLPLSPVISSDLVDVVGEPFGRRGLDVVPIQSNFWGRGPLCFRVGRMKWLFSGLSGSMKNAPEAIVQSRGLSASDVRAKKFLNWRSLLGDGYTRKTCISFQAKRFSISS